ncbi:MAG: response regulator transcription factor [Bacteroidota bacterium]
MKCIIIEDQPPAQRILKKYISDLNSLELREVFMEPTDALLYLNQHVIDLIFLDIHLPKLSGMDVLRMIPKGPHVILTTAFDNYALESYDFNVVDYLLKPFSFQRFVQAVSRVPTEHQALPENSPVDSSLFIKSGHEHIRIEIADILLIHSDTDYTELYTPSRKHLTQESLKYWLSLLDNKRFAQVHKSYIVNIERIEKVAGNQVYCQDGHVLPIGRAFKEDFMNQLAR